jgi:hypothetical protein
MQVSKAFKGARRQALGGLAVGLLAGCSSLPFNNPFARFLPNLEPIGGFLALLMTFMG